ncbi:MAG: SDR family oxidoreductase [Gammaproteobacteria bacterium]|nr:SDR family oxidoreductase [Gammaproteobacteria bacterium]
MDLGLNGKRAIILGGSRGIGWYTAKLLAAEGCSVALCARDADGVNQAIEALRKDTAGNHFGAAANLADGEATRGFVSKAIAELGGLDLLIHNASGFDSIGDEEGWARSFQVDVMAGVRAVEQALPALKESDAASITFIGSMASKYYFRRRNSYGAAKAAMRAYANELAQNFGRDGIRCNVVSPGAVHFPGGSWDNVKNAQPDFYRNVEKAIPLGRLGTGEELARIIGFVASPAGLWINSTHIAADGGQVAAVD